jgi:predicted nucleic acid-binding protein
VRIVVDANVVFSGILNSNGKIGDLLINSDRCFDFIAPEFLRTEIFRHHDRLCKISKLTSEQVREAEYHIYRDITFISEEQIRPSAWSAAIRLVQDVDPKDAHYVAYSRHFRCKIWSGDKELIKGLAQKGFTQFISTDELLSIRNASERRG